MSQKNNDHHRRLSKIRRCFFALVAAVQSCRMHRRTAMNEMNEMNERKRRCNIGTRQPVATTRMLRMMNSDTRRSRHVVTSQLIGLFCLIDAISTQTAHSRPRAWSRARLRLRLGLERRKSNLKWDVAASFFVSIVCSVDWRKATTLVTTRMNGKQGRRWTWRLPTVFIPFDGCQDC